MRLIPALALLCLLPLAASAEGEIYRWKDSNGVWHYSDQPQPGAELVRAARKPSGASAPATARPNPASTPATTDSPPVSAAVAQQVRDEAAAIKSEQCRKATELYENSLRARRLYRVDDQGNQVFLNDAEIDQARLSARSDRDLACGQQ